VNQVRRRANEGTNFIRYPFQVVSQAASKVAQQWYENAELPGGKKSQSAQPEPAQPEPAQPELASRNGSAASAQTAVQTGLPLAVAPLVPVTYPLPAAHLLPDTAIRSRWNSYTIGACLVEGERIRLYEGKTRSDEPVLIKEYQLDDDGFTPQELEERQKAFERLIELNQKIGNGPDFRIVKLIDAIALPKEQRCYLITKPINHNTTLAAYLSQSPSGSMAVRQVSARQVSARQVSARQVREVLRQVLESLRFLHTAYRVQFPSGDSERGLPHGNLSLHSLLVRHVDAGFSDERQFFIYLTDLELWEHLFHSPASPRFHSVPARSTRELGTVKDDLKALGEVGLHLAGGTLTPASAADPQGQMTWELNDDPLRQFIQRLLGLSCPFDTAEEALHELRKLPEPQVAIPIVTPVSVEAASAAAQTADRRWLIFAIVLLALAGVLGYLTWLTSRKTPQGITGTSPFPPRAKIYRIGDISSAPATFSYLVEPDGAWYYALARTFTTNAAPGEVAFRENLIEAIDNRHQGIDQITRENVSGNDVISQLRQGKADVALMRLPDPDELPADFEARPVAYDALVVFVPFSDPYLFRNTVAVTELERSITVEQLRQLYTSGTDTPLFPERDFRVKLFFSEDQETVRLFESEVLGNDPELVAKFRQVEAIVRARDLAAARQDRQPWDVYNRMWIDANQESVAQENETAIGIGFDRLGRTFDQCSVYPLAVSQAGAAPVQVLIQSNGNPIDQNTDLCGAKGSYLPSVQGYPLSYELGVVYPQNSEAGAALAEILNTTEGQYLMSEVGLVPTDPVQTLLSAIWEQPRDESQPD
jgi:hypothetical protein